MIGPGCSGMRRLGLLEHPDAKHGREQGRDAPRSDQRDRDDSEDRERVFARGAVCETDRDERRDRDQRAGQPRKGGRAIGEFGRLLLLVAPLQPRDHRLDGDHGVVDQETERDDEGAERDPLKVDSERRHGDEHDGEDERDRERHDGAGAHSEGDEADAKDDGDGLPQRLHEVGHGVLHGDGLVGDERRFDADGQVRLDLGHGVLDVAPEREHIAALAHGDGEPDALLSVDAEHRLRRVGRAARDARDVAQTDHPAVRDEIDRQDVLLRPERARDADEDFFVPGLHHALRRDGVLGLEGGDQRGAVDPEASELLGRELHIDALVLGPEDVDLRDVRQLEELLADVVHSVPQLPMGEPVGGEAVDDAVSVAELVVEAGADDALRQGAADVADLLAHLIPDVRDLSRRRRVPSG